MNKKLIRLFSLALAVMMVFSLCSCSGTAPEDEEKEPIKYASEIPSGKAEVIEQFNKVMAIAKSGKVAISYSLDQGAGGCECENPYVKASFKTLANKMTDTDFGMSTEYGESTKDIFPLMGTENAGSLDFTDVSSAIITDNEGDTNYTIIIKINPETNPEQENSIYGKLYKISKDEDILKNFDGYKDFATADSYSATYGTGTIKAIVDKSTDHIVKLELSRDVKVATEVTGQGTLASVGTVAMTFDYWSTAHYDLNWDNPETADVEA